MAHTRHMADSTLERWGKNVRAARRSACLSQEQVAEALVVPQSTVSRWEGGKLEPGHHHKVALAGVLGVAPIDLFPFEVT